MRSSRYEPYVIVPRLPSTPLYNEGFSGYGKNKIQFVMHLRYAGFKFRVLPFGFVTHMQHSKSALKGQWEDSATGHRDEMDALFRHFIEGLHATHRETRKVPDCTPRQAQPRGGQRQKPRPES
jgi:glycosyltransferase-like protein LARGE